MNFYIANDLNQYTLVPEENRFFQYDPDGNLVSDGEWTYSWDAENRLVAASNASCAITFEYDYLGRRIGKTVNGVRSSFVYDGWSLLRETTGTNATHYVWGADVSQRMQGAGDIGGLLCVRVGGTPYYPCADGNGNIVGYVDGTGATVARREYSPFGETVAEIGTAPAGLRIWFSSKYLDEETGLYYYGYRYYHPGLGRWLSRDPLEELDSGNLYAFVLNMPTFAVDLYGFSTEIECHKWNPADFSKGIGGDVDMKLKWWIIDSELSFNVGLSGQMCNICCSDGSVEKKYEVDFNLGWSLAFSTATWGGKIDLGEGVEGSMWLGVKGGLLATAQVEANFAYDGCSKKIDKKKLCFDSSENFSISVGGIVAWRIKWWEQSFGVYGEAAGSVSWKKCGLFWLDKGDFHHEWCPKQVCVDAEVTLHVNVAFNRYSWVFWKRNQCFPKLPPNSECE